MKKVLWILTLMLSLLLIVGCGGTDDSSDSSDSGHKHSYVGGVCDCGKADPDHRHIGEDPTVENKVEPTCSAEGGYEEVVYCSICEEEISRVKKTIEKLAHTSGEPTEENRVETSCAKAGGYDIAVYCTVCGGEVSREEFVIDALPHSFEDGACSACGAKDPSVCEHIFADAVIENEVYATCIKEGSYDEVVYCSVCGDELSRKTITTNKEAHAPADAVMENEVFATCTKEGSYDEVVYCSKCGIELSRVAKALELAEHKFVDGRCECGEADPNYGVHTHSFSDGKCSCGAVECKVRIRVAMGAQVVGNTQVSVARGESAQFTVKLSEGYVFTGVKSSGKELEAEYDAESGVLVVYGISGNQNIDFHCNKVDYDTTVKYYFHFSGTDKDSASHANGEYLAGTEITLTASDMSLVFDGWSYGGTLDSGGELISTLRNTTFFLSEEYTVGGKCYIFPNYSQSGTLKIDVNGGIINYKSQNLTATTYYSISGDEAMVRVTFNTDWFEEVGAPYTFWDDGSFTREGYILKEYNTRADGLGTGYSIGSKYPMDEGSVLYCIWAKDTTHTDFIYRDISIPLPSGSSAAYAPNWVKDGIIITEYVGDDDTVVIPEKIDGKYVIAIGARAFVDKGIKELVAGRRVAKIEDDAFVSCENLTTFYYPDSIAYITNEAFDDATYSSFKNFYVNATMAPRFSKNEGGSFAKKFARLIANYDKNRIVVISGSSSYCGLSTEYLEMLIDNDEYCVVNFGTTRTTQIYMYLEAMSEYAHEGDIILYAPENSIYEMGEPRLYWKTLRDLEGMYNIFRYVDISGYENVFGAFAEFNMGTSEGAYDTFEKGRYERASGEYGDIVKSGSFNEYGEYITAQMSVYCKEENYKAVYEITLNNRFKSILEGEFSTAKPEEEPWQTSEKWCSADEEKYLKNMNRAIEAAKSSGALVYFTFAPIDYNAVTEQAKADLANWCDDYEEFIISNYSFDGILGQTEDYIFAHKYFYNNAYHTNNYGRVYRTYQMYRDLCPLLGIETPFKVLDKAFAIEGCNYEYGAVDGPLTPYLP